MKAEMHYGIELRRASGLEAAIGAGVGFYKQQEDHIKAGGDDHRRAS